MQSGYTVREVAKLFRVGKSKVLKWIERGELLAINTSNSPMQPRYIILPDSLASFVVARELGAKPKSTRRKPRKVRTDHFPDC